MKKQIANSISALRIIASPIVIYLLVAGHVKLATFLYLLGLFTDVLDGFVARKLGTANKFGEIWDPITSVILFYSTSFTLALLGHITWFYPLVIGAYSSISFVKAKQIHNDQSKKQLHQLDIAIGGGLGDIGLGLLMSYLFLRDLFVIIVMLAFVTFVLKNLLQRLGKANS